LTIPDEPWRLVCSAEQFDRELRDDKEFAFLVTAARLSSAIKFGSAAVHGAGRRNSNARSKQGFGEFLYLAGIVHEALALRATHAHKWGASSRERRTRRSRSSPVAIRQAMLA
jgi:hypothetical protein